MKRLAIIIAALLTAAACATTPTTTVPAAPGRADATVAVNARSAIDSVETLHVAACTWAIEQHNAKKISDDKFEQISIACDAVASAEETANAQLGVYLATGSLNAKQALSDALVAVATAWSKLDAAKKEVHP
jgi:hypothetical protein